MRSVFCTDPTEEDKDNKDKEETHDHNDKHDKDNNNLQPLTNDDLTIVGERTRRLLDSV